MAREQNVKGRDWIIFTAHLRELHQKEIFLTQQNSRTSMKPHDKTDKEPLESVVDVAYDKLMKPYKI